MLAKLTTAIAIALLTTVSACKTAKKADSATDGPTGPNSAIEDGSMGDSDSGKAMGLRTVNFPYDAFNLTDEARGILRENARIMKEKGSLRVQIEGHCDMRGGVQYNIALGEKRANAVKSFLESQGVSANRLATISYGKERLLDPGTSEDAHARNRRANFSITGN